MRNRKASPAVAAAAAFLVGMLSGMPIAYGYIGPGAGFAFLSSFLIFFFIFLLAFFVLITLPVRMVLRALRRRRAGKPGRCRRVVILGLDGMSPTLARHMMDAGTLPNFSTLAGMGAFHPLRTTAPSASPVAWSTFQTGTNPGKHNIFDFLTRNKRTYLPELSSARIEPPGRSLKLGRYRIPIGRPRLSLLRKSQPFWKVLGEQGIFSMVLRVPITFPPERFHGVLLSGMCVPDLRGSQGSFTYFTTGAEGNGDPTGGMRLAAKRKDGLIRGSLPGPPNPLRPDAGALEVPFTVTPNGDSDSVVLECQGNRVELKERKYSPWVRVTFRAGPGFSASGICRFYIRQIEPDFELYVTPIHIDPDRPSLPISHPFTYAPYLGKVFGPYATLGLAEDTWAVNEGIIDGEAFLEQVHAIHEEREKMLFDAMDKVEEGLVVCVFDATDRIQHMFWRDGTDDGAVREVYQRMDEMVGRVTAKLGEDDVLIVMSDHGFGSFRRCVNLNAWLKEKGFLHLKDGADECEDYFKGVDWSKTRAYAVGLGGIFINEAGREGRGIVPPGGEKDNVKKAIAEGLAELEDGPSGGKVVSRVIDTAECYWGPYRENAPDLIAGFADGYRVDWDSVTGKFGSTVIRDNEKAWGGDHCIDPDLVPGVFFCNRPAAVERPGIVDIAPTVLDAFGVAVPKYMDGRPILSWKDEEKGG
ncbi:MAG: nucleotide pyrophosphatase [Planctomycetes bacterium]|nr:nucleotide pyrophosphatase [Planctomycetota bacterium]